MRIEKYPCEDLSLLPSELGQAVTDPSGEPTFTADILSYWDGIASWQISGETGIGWFELKRRPFIGEEVERHVLTPEALLCFRGAAACLIGKPKESGMIERDDFHAFHIEPGQGIIFPPGGMACPSFSRYGEGGILGHFSKRNRAGGFAGCKSAAGAEFPISNCLMRPFFILKINGLNQFTSKRCHSRTK